MQDLWAIFYDLNVTKAKLLHFLQESAHLEWLCGKNDAQLQFSITVDSNAKKRARSNWVQIIIISSTI